jgi:hypothetical protein
MRHDTYFPFSASEMKDVFEILQLSLFYFRFVESSLGRIHASTNRQSNPAKTQVIFAYLQIAITSDTCHSKPLLRSYLILLNILGGQ